MLKDISEFFSTIWNAYIMFMTKIFGYNLSIGITVVLVFIVLCLIFLKIINSRK